MRIKYLFFLFFALIISFHCSQQEEARNDKMPDEKMAPPKDPYQKFCQYWEVLDAESPTMADIYDQHEDGIYNYPGIIFMTDSTFLEGPRSTMRYGKFQYKGRIIDAIFDDGTKAQYFIKAVQGDSMVMERTESKHKTILYVKGDNTFWPDASVNPYNKKNSAWRIKPLSSETPEQLKERLKGCILFYQYLFEGAAVSSNDKLDFLGLPCCFKWYQGGIIVQGPKHLDKKWMQCFYSQDQAMQARQLMEDVLTNNKYNWDTTQTNWLRQTADVLKQIYRKM